MGHTRQLPYRGRSLIACLSLSSLILTANQTRAQDRPFPYSLGERDIMMLTVGYTLSEMGESLRQKVDPIKLEEIRGLTRDDVNAFDRTATRNWSYAWGERSDEYREE